MIGALSVEIETNIDAPAYAEIVQRSLETSLYHTPAWLTFLQTILKGAEPRIFLARSGGGVQGALATFVGHGPMGPVVNALPYFGSHGDLLLAPDPVEPEQTCQALAKSFHQFCAAGAINSVNIVSGLMTSRISHVAHSIGLARWDERIGQVSELQPASNRELALDAVLAACTQKTRNLVRKGMKQGFRIDISDDETDWQNMVLHHRLGMERIGGRAKTAAEFTALRRALSSNDYIRLYVARHDNVFAGALLCICHRDWVEYFTPVAVENYRNGQVLSALIAEAMIDARMQAYRFWNWGGTWATQSGVYHFKRGWGAKDHRYGYYGRASQAIVAASPSDLAAAYPGFYLRPFNAVPESPATKGTLP